MHFRERILAILKDNGVAAEASAVIAGQIIALGRAKGVDIVHEIGPNGFHRLTLNELQSPWTPPTDIIKLDDFIATTDAFINMLPQVGKVFELSPKDETGKGDFVTLAVQRLF